MSQEHLGKCSLQSAWPLSSELKITYPLWPQEAAASRQWPPAPISPSLRPASAETSPSPHFFCHAP